MTVGALLRRPSAFTPLAMSLAALTLIGAALTGVIAVPTQPHDEGTPARLFQLLLVLQVPVILGFAARWVPRAPRAAITVVSLQAAAALLAFGTVLLLEW